MKNYFHSFQFRHAPQHPYGPGINPCDFFLFGDLKTKFNGGELEITKKLQDKVKELFGQITSRTMRRAYKDWIRRLNQMYTLVGTTSKANDADINFTSEE
jgi:hypothetical protein